MAFCYSFVILLIKKYLSYLFPLYRIFSLLNETLRILRTGDKRPLPNLGAASQLAMY